LLYFVFGAQERINFRLKKNTKERKDGKKTTKMSRKNRAVVVWVSKEGGIISSKWGKIQK